MTLERIQVDVPDQPPNGSVVLAGGVAWQRRDFIGNAGTWYAANESENGLHWSHLVVDCGPLDVLHIPTEKATR
ncbi:hypothetical protein [Pseudonocardia broussonetiae]|uniref:Uncharacterized protein n=1 Tax=Pseudonocardia broussonetiae TaxID=2736640 RepID=A0A6M6JK25_9PSEU|nr:hypothetical protein [Pseudonocardia broussonetiae]QJY46691.1 hypothetical protein HOP40_13385 [Pseudonocardia broussonetiae]